MKGILVGGGFISRGHLEAYFRSSRLSVTAVADKTRSRRDTVRRAFPELKVYDSLESALDEEDAQFVDICTPPGDHKALMIRALEAGKHVLCEKPLLLELTDYDQVRSMADSVDRRVMAAHNYRFSPAARVMEEAVADHRFGSLLGGHFRTVRAGHAKGIREYRPDWRRDPKIGGGGILTDHGPHSVYLAAMLVGRWPSRVSCLGGNLSEDQWRDTEDSVWLTLDYDGIQFRVDLTWSGSERSTQYLLWGAGGTVRVDGNAITTAYGGTVDDKTVMSDFDDATHRSWFGRVLDAFANCVDSHSLAAHTLHEPFMTSMVIEAAYRSMRSGGAWMKVPQL